MEESLCTMKVRFEKHTVMKVLLYVIHALGYSGPPCIMFSMMGKRRRCDDPNFQTHKDYYRGVVAEDYDLLVIENVPEYEENVVAQELGDAYTLHSCRVDPRCLGFGTARRGYLMENVSQK